jgi:uncharacterized membrane protein YgdD (TMEM256/DUF423 family)
VAKEQRVQRFWIGFGALAGFGAVAMAAVAAHGLQGLPAAAQRMVQSAIEMQGWHALALIGTGLWVPQGGRLANLAGAAVALGLVMFCAAVYLLALTGVSLGVVAPIGGTLCMAGWLLLALSAVRAR